MRKSRKLKSLSALYDALTELTDDTKIEMDLTDVEDDGMHGRSDHLHNDVPAYR